MGKAKNYWSVGILLFAISLAPCVVAQSQSEISARNSSRQSQNAQSGVAFSLDPGAASDPMRLLSATHNAVRDLLAAGMVRNVSSSEITAYRIGAILYPVDPLQRPAVRLGPLMSVPDGIAPGAQYELQGQGFSPALMGGRRSLVFFIAEVRLANGVEWQADIHQIAKNYQLSPE